jgi:hypothetical protein
MAESAADVDRPIVRAVDQLEGDDLFGREFQHGETRASAQINPADLLIPEGRVEGERSGDLGNAVRGVESPHDQVACHE